LILTLSNLEPALIRWMQRRLLTWFGRCARKLPWRLRPQPYRVWLSEIMLQQTQVATVLPYYRRFLRRFPTVRALAKASQDAVLKAWEGLGYYSRARNLHQAARLVIRNFHGQVPDSASGWRGLPGIGPYTANAIASISQGERVPVVDGNVSRVWARFFRLEGAMDRPATKKQLWDLAGQLVPGKAPGDFNQAVMELGALVCLPRNPACPACPLAPRCQAQAAGQVDKYPRRRGKRPIPHWEVVAAVLKRGERYLVGRRPASGLLGGLWEFPGGKVEPGETLPQALRREIEEELGLHVRVGKELVAVDHAYTHFSVTLHAFACVGERGEPQPRFHQALRWVSLEKMRRLAFPRANHTILNFLGQKSRGKQSR
jgi:A/G-specific adenine glycosylase